MTITQTIKKTNYICGMKGFLILIMVVLFGFNAIGQTKGYAGRYWSGEKDGTTASGVLYIYPETDTTFLFYLELSNGAPSYNSGSTTGRARLLRKDSAIYIQQDDDELCGFYFKFYNNKIIVDERENKNGCGYGGGVGADGIYIREDKKIPQYFIDREGDTTFFAKLNYQKEK